MDRDEFVREKKFRVELVAPDGLGFGAGSIGVRDRVDSLEDGLTAEVLGRVDEAIHSDDILVDIDCDKDGKHLDDDGCGDGRGVARVFEGAELRAKSLARSKVFGGAPVMVGASDIGLGRAVGHSLNQLFRKAVDKLKECGIGFGGHSDTHAHGENCGCGAIDKAPAIVANVVEEQDSIRAAVSLLGLNAEHLDGDEGIIANYVAYYESEVKGKEADYTGRSALQHLLDDGKVVKELDGDHTEVRVVLNTVPGKTVNQGLIREISGGLAQVFCVDIPRLQQIAESLYDDFVEREKALVSMVAHTLGVAGVLTKGDLPVYVISEASDAATVEDPEFVAA